MMDNAGTAAAPSLDETCSLEDGTNPRKLLRWSKGETLLLLEAKKRREDGLLIPQNGSIPFGGENEKISASDVHKWKRISDSLKLRGVDRDHVACKKRWFHLVSDFKKIQDWQRASGPDSFWIMQPQERREKRLPSGFDKDIYRELDAWLGTRPAISTAGILDSGISAVANVADSNLDFEVENEALADLGDRVHGAASKGYHIPDFDSSWLAPEIRSTCRKKRRAQFAKDAEHVETRDKSDLRESLIHVLEKNGRSMEAALRESCEAQIEAQKQLNQAQLEAQKQIIEMQMQQGREFVRAMYALVGVVGELAKSMRMTT